METKGFDYHIDEEILKNYQKKSLKLRLKWLYYGNKFRQKYPKDIIEMQEKMRGTNFPPISDARTRD